MADLGHPIMVGGREIPAAAIAAEAQNHPAPDAEGALHAAARALVIRQLLLDEADRLGIAATGRSDDAGRALTEEDDRIEALLEQEVKVPEADEATARRYYDTNRARFTTAPLVEAEHILFAAAPDDAFAYSMATGDARTVIRQLESDPGAFAELARTHSACPSREQGGNLGQIGPGQTVEPFEEALFALPEGTLCTEPVKTRFGVHVIRAGRRVEGSELPFDLVRDRIVTYLEEASWRRAVSQYLAILAARSEIDGIELPQADGLMVQ